MGMQCFFAVEDVDPDSVKKENMGMSGYEVTINIRGEGFTFWSDWEFKTCWFDIGYMSDSSMAKLKFLIRNRIPFSCS